jgi:hypothetical protein
MQVLLLWHIKSDPAQGFFREFVSRKWLVTEIHPIMDFWHDDPKARVYGPWEDSFENDEQTPKVNSHLQPIRLISGSVIPAPMLPRLRPAQSDRKYGFLLPNTFSGYHMRYTGVT